MNETRKEIIGLIEPYMDKEHWLWCTYLFEEDWFKPRYITIGSEWWLPNWRTIQILWHYDITAVEKYIRKNSEYRIETSIEWTNKILFIQDDEDNEMVDFETIPNKPLHLYTEQEEKNLLEILKQLSND